MARPLIVGTESKRKNNDNKHPHVREEWTKGKKLGRPKQVWVWDSKNEEKDQNGEVILVAGYGHWEKVGAL